MASVIITHRTLVLRLTAYTVSLPTSSKHCRPLLRETGSRSYGNSTLLPIGSSRLDLIS